MQTISKFHDFPEEKVKVASEGLRAIAHPLRLKILCCLLQQPLCVSELLKLTGASQSNISQHLNKMRLQGVLENERNGQQMYYSIANENWQRVIHALQHIYCPEMSTDTGNT
ncbi:MAG: metalloregulator ArsR/SmtB family transcription factor [Mariprofundales bacterium]